MQNATDEDKIEFLEGYRRAKLREENYKGLELYSGQDWIQQSGTAQVLQKCAGAFADSLKNKSVDKNRHK